MLICQNSVFLSLQFKELTVFWLKVTMDITDSCCYTVDDQVVNEALANAKFSSNFLTIFFYP